MDKQELAKHIDSALSEEFDSIVLAEFCSQPKLAMKSIETAYKYDIEYSPPEIWRRIKVDIEQNVTFAKMVTKDNAPPAADITISGSFTHMKGQMWFSFTDFCAIFFPRDRFQATGEWQKTLKANIKTLREDLANLYERDISIAISSEEERNKAAHFWEKPEHTLKQQFYVSAYPIVKKIVERAVPEITLGARWGSDSPYQRFKEPEKWALISFRATKRQQVDIVQFVEGKRLRFKCALIDLGFLENGYGKVAKIREVISQDVALDAPSEKILRFQSDFMARVLKELPILLEAQKTAVR